MGRSRPTEAGGALGEAQCGGDADSIDCTAALVSCAAAIAHWLKAAETHFLTEAEAERSAGLVPLEGHDGESVPRLSATSR